MCRQFQMAAQQTRAGRIRIQRLGLFQQFGLTVTGCLPGNCRKRTEGMCGIVREEGDVPGSHQCRRGIVQHVYPRLAVADQMEGRGVAAAGRGHVPGVAQLADVIHLRAEMQVAQEIVDVSGVG